MRFLIGLSLLAGAVHVVAPDHWVPASVLAWRRRWRGPKTIAVVASVLSAHVAAGFALYLLLTPWLASSTRGPRVFTDTLALVAFMGFLRIVRYPRVRAVLHSPPTGLAWSMVSVVSVIGPAEALVPVLVRARELGASIAAPLGAFWIGTVASGILLTLIGPWIWDRPLLMPRGLAWAERRRAAIPIVMGVALAATWLLR